MTASPIRLRILHTNDIHSHFEQMPLIAAAFDELRNELGHTQTLTLDIGDHLDRVSPLTEGTGGRANIDLIAATGYDAITLGNNEGLTFTGEALHELYSSIPHIPVLCSNLQQRSTGTYPAWGAPYHLVEKSGITIGIIGLTAYYPDFYCLLGWEIQEPIQAAAELVSKLRPQVDLLIVLSHLGLKTDERMALEVPGIDVILGGHTHHLLEQPIRMGNTILCGAGKFGQYVGVVDLTLDPVTRRLVQMEGFVRGLTPEYQVETERSITIVQQMESRILGHKEEAEKALALEVANLKRPLEADWFHEAPFGNLLAAALRKWSGAEIGLVNAGQLLEGLDQGIVTAGRLLEICPSPINPCRVKLTGSQIIHALEESLLPEFTEKRIYGFGFRGKVLGMLNISGLTVEYDPASPPLSRIKQVYLDSGERLQPDNAYVVGTIDMFTFGIGYLTLSQGSQTEYLLPEFIRDLIRQELNDPAAVRHSELRRWLPVTNN